jgi:hypothetical protein
MTRKLLAIAALAALLLLGHFPRTAQGQDAEMSLYLARTQALERLLADVRALKLQDGKTVGDMLDALKVDVPWESLLAGTQERLPARYYDTGECEVALRIQAKPLRENIERLIKQHAPAAKGLAPDVLPNPEEHLAVEMAVEAFAEAGRRRPAFFGPPADLAGWGGVDALERTKVEHAALAVARARVGTQLDALLEGFPKAAELKEKLAAITAAVVPESRAYLEGGVVAIELRMKTTDALAALRAENEKLPADKKFLDEAQLADLEKRLHDKTLAAVAYTLLCGASPDEKELDRYVPLKSENFPGMLPKPKPPAGPEPEAKPGEGAVPKAESKPAPAPAGKPDKVEK